VPVFSYVFIFGPWKPSIRLKNGILSWYSKTTVVEPPPVSKLMIAPRWLSDGNPPQRIETGRILLPKSTSIDGATASAVQISWKHHKGQLFCGVPALVIKGSDQVLPMHELRDGPRRTPSKQLIRRATWLAELLAVPYLGIVEPGRSKAVIANEHSSTYRPYLG